MKCPKCKRGSLNIRHDQHPEGIVGWNNEKTEYTEGIKVTYVKCDYCEFEDTDVSVYD